MTGRILVPLVASAALAVPAFSQTADELIAKSLEARGGLPALKAVTSVRMRGTLSVGPLSMPLVVEMKRPARIRTEVTVEGMTSVQAFDGRNGWGIPPGGRQPEVLPDEMASDLADRADIDGSLVDYAAKGHRVVFAGKRTVDGRDAFALELTKKSGEVERYLIDAQSYLPVRVETRRAFQGRTIEVQTKLGDYKAAGGFLWPHSIENEGAGQPDKQALRLSSIEVNPALDESRFRMPQGAVPPGRD